MQAYYLKLRKEPPDHGKYNPLQKAGYTGVVFLLLPFLILTGLCMSPGFDTIAHPIVNFLGGRQFARTWHFLAMLFLVVFTFGHVFLVLTTGRREQHALDDARHVPPGQARRDGRVKRGLFVASTMTAALTGCTGITNALNGNATIRRAVGSVDLLSHPVIGARGLAKTFPDDMIARDFPTNGLSTPNDAAYTAAMRSGFASYRMPVGGLVEHPQTFSLAELHALGQVSQTTRHDCVEGWSVVGKWGGVTVGDVLALVKPKPSAKYVVFYTNNVDESGTPFYGSIDLEEAMKPQTLLALMFNGKPTAPQYGGPVRLRLPTQLAYKSTKWVTRIALVDSFAPIYGGKGGYWEDAGYEWWAGI